MRITRMERKMTCGEDKEAKTQPPRPVKLQRRER